MEEKGLFNINGGNIKKNKKNNITEMKSKNKITNIKNDDIKYLFTCPKCGNHKYKDVVVSNHKFAGAGLTPTMTRVCSNCSSAIEIPDRR